MADFRVIIIGGGLSGPLLANGLMANDIDFVLYERDFEHAKHEGYQIRLGEGALRGFSACLTQSHTEAILRKLGKSTGTLQTAPSVYTSRFEQLVDCSKIPSYTRSAAINRVVLRDLIMEPIKASRRVQYRKEFSAYEVVHVEDGGEKVRVHFKDGSSDVCDILIGADGSRSKINRQLGLDNLVPLDSHWAFLSKGMLPYERVLELPEELQKGPIIVFSKKISLYYALYLPENFQGQADSANDKKAISYDEEAVSFYWGMNAPVEMIPYRKPEDIKDRRQLCLDLVNDWAPEFHRMLSIGGSDEEAAAVHVTTLNASRRPGTEWREDVRKQGSGSLGHPRVWLIGDAIHAMQPNRGQGGNQAMADCADLLPQILKLNSLTQEGSGRPLTDLEIGMACREYEAAMIARAFTWVWKSGGASIPVSMRAWLGPCTWQTTS